MEMVKLSKLFVFFQIYFNVGITIFFRFYRPWAIFIILDALGAAYAMNVLMAFPLLLTLIIKSIASMIFPSNYRIKIFVQFHEIVFPHMISRRKIFFFQIICTIMCSLWWRHYTFWRNHWNSESRSIRQGFSCGLLCLWGKKDQEIWKNFMITLILISRFFFYHKWHRDVECNSQMNRKNAVTL